MPESQNITFSDLQVHYGTGRSFVVSGTGRNRRYGYRTGKMCNFGDLKESEWRKLVKDLIHQSGEDALYHQLHHFMAERNCTRATPLQLELECLELHASRIFENPKWVYYIPFNRLYRPHVLKETELVTVIPACCKVPGQVTEAQLQRDASSVTGPCPHCLRWTEIEICQI